jgi:hypothetical protein
MKSTAPLPTIPLFTRTASASSQCPFLLQEKEQVKVGQSPQRTWNDVDYQYEEFIRGHDPETGEEVCEACNSEKHKFFAPVFFKKDVLNIIWKLFNMF